MGFVPSSERLQIPFELQPRFGDISLETCIRKKNAVSCETVVTNLVVVHNVTYTKVCSLHIVYTCYTFFASVLWCFFVSPPDVWRHFFNASDRWYDFS